ncbi:MAG: prepilin-type N-terminal cleavage/methylation domain-containing protein [Verrucomicrobiota bacterium]
MTVPVNPPEIRRAGFTLVELLLSMAVMILIFALCGTMIQSTQNILGNGMKKIDADAEARLVFDRLSVDFASLIKRTDVDYIVKNSLQPQPGNDNIAFFSKASGYYSTNPDPAPRKTVSLLAYRVNSQSFQLERLAKGTGWNTTSSGTPMVFLPATLIGTWPSIAVSGTDSDYQVLADGVFRFEYCYILRDGTFSKVPYLPSHSSMNGWQDVVALYIAIAVLDDRSRKLVSGSSSLGAVAAAFNDFQLRDPALPDPSITYPPITQWEAVINQPNFAAKVNLPLKAAQAIRVFARTIPVNNLPADSSL